MYEMTEPTKYVATTRRPLVLAERLRELGWVWEATGQPVVGQPIPRERRPFSRERFAGATPVVLDSVSDWWDDTGRVNAEGVPWPDDRLTPNYRLPWPAVWAEWVDGFGGQTAAVVNGWLPERMHRGLLLREVSTSRLPRESAARFMGASVLLFAESFVMVGVKREISRAPGIAVPANLDGTPFKKGDDGTVFSHVEPGGDTWAAQLTWEALGVWRLFSALLGVRNIGVADVDLSRAHRRQLARQATADSGPPPFVRYKTLTLTLPAPNSSGGLHEDGPPAPIPFHLVRGHLADYRTGKGLFGKYRTVVWIPMHTRGHQRVGAVAKSYGTRVIQPNAGEPTP